MKSKITSVDPSKLFINIISPNCFLGFIEASFLVRKNYLIPVFSISQNK